MSRNIKWGHYFFGLTTIRVARPVFFNLAPGWETTRSRLSSSVIWTERSIAPPNSSPDTALKSERHMLFQFILSLVISRSLTLRQPDHGYCAAAAALLLASTTCQGFEIIRIYAFESLKKAYWINCKGQQYLHFELDVLGLTLHSIRISEPRPWVYECVSRES
jgi:hypothetical protein